MVCLSILFFHFFRIVPVFSVCLLFFLPKSLFLNPQYMLKCSGAAARSDECLELAHDIEQLEHDIKLFDNLPVVFYVHGEARAPSSTTVILGNIYTLPRVLRAMKPRKTRSKNPFARACFFSSPKRTSKFV